MSKPATFENGRGETICTKCGKPVVRRKCGCFGKRPPNTGNLTLAELERHAQDMCQRYWGVDCTVRIELVNRLWKSMRGYYQIRKEKGVVTDRWISLSKPTNAQRTKEQVLGTLLHELVHWRLETTGRRWDDRDEEFVAECMRVAAPLSGTKEAKKAALAYAKKIASA